MYHLCKVFGRRPSDSFFEEMDPIEKLWFYESWAHEIELDLEAQKAQAILAGSFANPELARQMVKKREFESTDEDFEKTFDIVKQGREEFLKAQPKKRRRKKRQIIR